MTAKPTTLWTLYVHVILNSVSFTQKFHDVVVYTQSKLSTCQVFFSKYYSYKLSFELLQNTAQTDE